MLILIKGFCEIIVDIVLGRDIRSFFFFLCRWIYVMIVSVVCRKGI